MNEPLISERELASIEKCYLNNPHPRGTRPTIIRLVESYRRAITRIEQDAEATRFARVLSMRGDIYDALHTLTGDIDPFLEEYHRDRREAEQA